jgi:valyl-tRNA synthetase
MEKVYQHQEIEKKWYGLWEKSNYFTPKIDKNKKPFTIILPLPNANDPMHMGHALFTVQDIMVRYHRMLGDASLWLPGADHAGYETQFVFEKKLSKEGKSRFDFDRNTLYQKIWEFVEQNRKLNKEQLKRLGFSLDWTRYHYSLEPEIIEKVFSTFIKLFNDGLVYRGERLVNFCTRCGTAFSDLEIKYVERSDPLYYLKYGPFVLATTRPETKFGDTAVCFHPGDKRYKKYLGKEIDILGVNGSFKVQVIEDKEIDPKFGTGVEKVTPAHDFLDFEIGVRHKLPLKKVIDSSGRLTEAAGRFAGMKVNAARLAVYKEMEKMGLIDHVDNNYTHNVAVCYRCGTVIEPMLMPQWYISTKPLAIPAINAVQKGKTKIVPKKRFTKMYFDWMKNILDWNISRQTVWGPRIPVWYCLDCNSNIQINFLTPEKIKISKIYKELKNNFTLKEIMIGLQSLIAPKDATYQLSSNQCEKCQGNNLLQETDTFDTWFLSGQWPLTTLGLDPASPEKSSPDFKYFYPTTVMDTMWDILFFWVGRMMMFGLYLTGDVPFKVVHIHARVVDKFGKKMSKSKGNVIDPIVMVNQYGADALRMALVTGIAPASDIAISDEKVRGMRNFSNKIWNIGRFLKMNLDQYTSNKIILPKFEKISLLKLSSDEKKILARLNKIVMETTKNIENYHFGRASEILYAFIWHEFADKYIEESKESLKKYNPYTLMILLETFLTCLKLLHPFMPFITEEIAKQLGNNKPLIISDWPKSI